MSIALPLDGFWETRGLKGPLRRLGSDSEDGANFDLSWKTVRKEEKLESPNG